MRGDYEFDRMDVDFMLREDAHRAKQHPRRTALSDALLAARAAMAGHWTQERISLYDAMQGEEWHLDSFTREITPEEDAEIRSRYGLPVESK